VPNRDQELIQIVDAAFADSAKRSGELLVCRPGCTQCCVGAFAIHALDVQRLKFGMQVLQAADPERAARVRQRARDYIERVRADFPGDPVTGALSDTPEAQNAFEDFANDEVCPALDPATGMCDVYAHRPMTCRVFGPPVRTEDGIGHCELCYHGASDKEIAACEMVPDPNDLESQLLEELADDRQTIVAYAVVGR
jgi:Fe-S-cluster containining protein